MEADRTRSEDEDAVLRCILTRRSVMPKRLIAPGPDAEQVRRIVAAGVTVPDHGSLRPWRFVLVPEARRRQLADVFVAAGRAGASEGLAELVERERDKAYRAPTLIAVIARINPSAPQVPVSEQYASVGAAIQTILLAAHALGFGGIMLSGERVRKPLVRKAFGLTGHEKLVGFLSLGTPADRRAPKPRPMVDDHLSAWAGPPPDIMG